MPHSSGHHLLIQQISTYFVLYTVLSPELVALLDVRVSAFISWEKHIHKVISKGQWEQACVFK